MKVAGLLSDWTHYIVCLSDGFPLPHISRLKVAHLLHLAGTVCLHTSPGRSW